MCGCSVQFRMFLTYSSAFRRSVAFEAYARGHRCLLLGRATPLRSLKRAGYTLLPRRTCGSPGRESLHGAVFPSLALHCPPFIAMLVVIVLNAVDGGAGFVGMLDVGRYLAEIISAAADPVLSFPSRARDG